VFKVKPCDLHGLSEQDARACLKAFLAPVAKQTPSSGASPAFPGENKPLLTRSLAINERTLEPDHPVISGVGLGALLNAKIFISYRREEGASHAGRVHDRLEREFGRDALFMDVDATPLGVDFVKAIIGEVAKCGVMLAIIGPGWLDACDEEGNRRLHNKNDFVRTEIAAALKRDIPVIPILFEGTKVPKESQLPDDLKALATRTGLGVCHDSFHSDIAKLIRYLRDR
jgi:hypothetical protein